MRKNEQSLIFSLMIKWKKKLIRVLKKYFLNVPTTQNLLQKQKNSMLSRLFL